MPIEDMLATAGAGVSKAVLHRSPWLEDWRDFDWIEALERIDKSVDPTTKKADVEPLASLLRSQAELTQVARHHIADFLQRYNLTRLSHRPRTPGYDRSLADRPLEWADRKVQEFIDDGATLDEAVTLSVEWLVATSGYRQLPKLLARGKPLFAAATDLVARQEKQLRRFHRGQRTSSNRMRRRRAAGQPERSGAKASKGG